MSKIKMILIVLMSSFIGIVSNPEMPMASDSVAITGLDNANIVETVVKPEPEVAYIAPVEQTAVYQAPAYQATVYQTPVYQAPANYIQINGMTIPLAYTATTAEDAGGAQQAWYYQNGKHIYGHNLSYVFGFLDNAYDGGWIDGITFTVVMDGAVNTYTVTAHQLYTKVDAYTLTANGKEYTMFPIVNGYLNGVYHKMTIMTCYNGSAQRLVVYAD